VIRSVFLAASRNAWLERQFRTRSFARKAVKRFLAGESLDEALAASRDEQSRVAGVLLTLLGENVRGRDEARGVAEHYRTVLRRIREERLAAPGRPGAEISVKLTHLGLDLGEEVAREGLQAILQTPGSGDGTVWVDMEGSSYVDPTLGLYLALLRDHPNLGLCLQAYLRRTPADLERVLQAGGTVRLVK
jgi:proline dehydrogenase